MELTVWNLSASLHLTRREHEGAALTCFDEVTERVSRAANRFDPTSEISRLNRDREILASSDFLALLRAALRASELTDGACSPAILNALEAWGYDRDFDLLDHRDLPLGSGASRGDLTDVHIDDATGRVWLDGEVRVDLGATAKAWACDEIADRLAGLSGVAVEIGGDVAVRGLGPEGPWVIGISDTLFVGRDRPRIALAHGGVATSSRRVRRWRAGGREAHHIIDPRSGEPASGELDCVSVSAATCVEANAFSTAAVVWGRREHLSRVSAHGWSARAVCDNGDIVMAGGWPSEESAA
jgi:thiamine biosynthesis lipoprotein